MQDTVLRRRRAHGSGSVAYSVKRRRWVAIVNLADGHRRRKFCLSREEAEAAVEELIRLHKDKLGYFYRGLPRIQYFGLGPPAPRDTIPPRLRFEVLARDGFRCRYCGAPAPEVRLHVDHILPQAAGGETTAENLMTSCETCNLGKGPRPLS